MNQFLKMPINWALQPNIYMKKLKRNIGLMEIASMQPYDKGIINSYPHIKNQVQEGQVYQYEFWRKFTVFKKSKGNYAGAAC